MKLISVDTLKTFVEVDHANHDELLEQVVQQVSSRIEKALNRELKKEARTDYYNGGRRLYPLPAYPIFDDPVVVVTVDDTVKTLNTDYFIWEDEGLIEFRYATASTMPKNVKIDWTGGYAETDGVLAVPDDIKRAVTMQAAFEYRRRADIGLSTISMPDGSVSKQGSGKLLAEVLETIKENRKLPSER